MGSIASTARLNLSGFRGDRSINENSPLEAQVELVYHAAYHFAKANGFTDYSNNGRQGLRGKLVMSQVVESLFPQVTGDNAKTLRSIIYQVLRRSGAAVCMNSGESITPTWWINHTAPANLTIAIANVKSKQSVELTHTEKKLTATEAGEDRPPSPVSTRQKESTGAEVREEALRKQRELKAGEHQKFLDRVVEEIATNPQPLSVPDLHKLLGVETGAVSVTTFNAAVGKLVKQGKLVWRKETRDEALIRGNGRIPLATRPRLYATSPGPVPTRTAMPDGVPFSAHHGDRYDVAETPALTATAPAPAPTEITDQDVLRALRVKGYSIGELLKHLGLKKENRLRLQEVVYGLVDAGSLSYRHGRYFTARRPLETPEVPKTAAVAEERKEADLDRSDAPEDRFAQLAEYAKTLFPGAEELDELTVENASLKRHIVELEEKVRKQAAAIAALS